jgi:hypothetical protein
VEFYSILGREAQNPITRKGICGSASTGHLENLFHSAYCNTGKTKDVISQRPLEKDFFNSFRFKFLTHFFKTRHF